MHTCKIKMMGMHVIYIKSLKSDYLYALAFILSHCSKWKYLDCAAYNTPQIMWNSESFLAVPTHTVYVFTGEVNLRGDREVQLLQQWWQGIHTSRQCFFSNNACINTHSYTSRTSHMLITLQAWMQIIIQCTRGCYNYSEDNSCGDINMYTWECHALGSCIQPSDSQGSVTERQSRSSAFAAFTLSQCSKWSFQQDVFIRVNHPIW